MSSIAVVALNQLVMWYNPTRIQTWPRLLASVTREETFASMTAFTKTHISDRTLDHKHGAYIDLARSLPGLENTASGLLLRGVGVFEKESPGYTLSKEGADLAASYRYNAKADDWIRRLARLLISREPRLRVLLKQMSQEGVCLVFKGDGWFKGAVDAVRLFLPGEDPVFPFCDKPGTGSLRSWLSEDCWWALGEWRYHPLLGDFTDARFVGQLKPDFSLDRVGLRIRPALEVLLYLGVIKLSGAEAWLDKDCAIEILGDALAADFGWQKSETPVHLSPIQILASEVEQLKLDTGLIVTSELREALHRRGFSNPDKAIADFIKDGLVSIEGQGYGQERHGRGLYGDPAKQLIRLCINTSPN